MKRTTTKSSSRTTSKKVNFKFNPKDFSFFKIKWKSPKDQVENEVNINVDPNKFNTLEIKDNH